MDDAPPPSRDDPIFPPPKSDATDPSASSGSSRRKRKRQQVKEEEEPGGCDFLYDEQEEELNGDGNEEVEEEEEDGDEEAEVDDGDEVDGDETGDEDEEEDGNEEEDEEEEEAEVGDVVDDEQEEEVDGDEEEEQEEDPNEGDENVEQEEEDDNNDDKEAQEDPSETTPSAPHPLRYLSLMWEEEKRRKRWSKRNSSNNASSADNDLPDKEEERDDIRAWEDELALARHNCSVREKIRDCYVQAQKYEEEIEELKGKICMCEMEAVQLEQELFGIMVLPKLHDHRKYGEDFVYDIDSKSRYWDRTLPLQVKRSKELAWALLRANDEPLPIPFQQMLWMDPECPLRNDREILLASIDKGIDGDRITMLWNQEMANDRELVLKCFEKCPGCISAETAPHLLKPYLSDMETLRTFAFASGRREIYVQFAPELFIDPEFMADLVLHQCRCNGSEQWVYSRLREAFPLLEWKAGWVQMWRYTARKSIYRGPVEPPEKKSPKPSTKSIDGTLLDNVDFVIRVAEGLALLSSGDRRYCPVGYIVLPVPVRKNPTVALAFAKIGARELWAVAAEHDPLAICQRLLLTANLSPSVRQDPLSHKELVLHLLETSRTHEAPQECLRAFAKFFLNCSPEILNDREINMQVVVASAIAPSVDLIEKALATARWVQRRDFWTELAEDRRCPCAAWALVPKKLASDERLVLAWARWASPDGALDWLADTIASFPNLGLLSDRKVLLNWIPLLCCEDPTAEAVWRQVPEAKLRRSLWIEVIRTLESPRYLLSYIPENLRSNPGVFDAQLRCAAKDGEVLAKCFEALSPALRERYVPRIVQAIQSSNDDEFFNYKWSNVWNAYALYRFPEAVRAILAKGGCFDHYGHGNLAWRDDPEFLLLVADVTAKHPESRTFWNCCSEALRRDKTFLLRVLEGKNVPMLYPSGDLEHDFDIQCALHSRQSEKEIHEHFGDGADVKGGCSHYAREKAIDKSLRYFREVRSRLQSYVSLETILDCVQSTMSTSIPSSFLGQDDFKQRLVEYVGYASISHDEARDLRRLSNKLILAGF